MTASRNGDGSGVGVRESGRSASRVATWYTRQVNRSLTICLVHGSQTQDDQYEDEYRFIDELAFALCRALNRIHNPCVDGRRWRTLALPFALPLPLPLSAAAGRPRLRGVGDAAAAAAAGHSSCVSAPWHSAERTRAGVDHSWAAESVHRSKSCES
jgi:hypothetical protein